MITSFFYHCSMLFNSLNFIYFFIVVLLLYFSIPHKWRWLLLLSASCYFYMFFIPIYILILFFTIIIDYYAGIWIEQEKNQQRKKTFLALSIIANVGILVFFKYYSFLNDNLSALLGLVNVENKVPYLNIILPVGLSFHTFQAMSYNFEIYRGKQKAERHLGYYALYVLYFPQLVAGPIERPQNVLHQFHQKHQWNWQRCLHGLQLIVYGFFKKVVIADRIALLINPVFSNYSNASAPELICAVLLFSVQIFCDFSGYSDIAIGSSKILGIELMKNFDKPYFASSISSFWRKWHISLSTWFRDYIYIPLGGSKTSTLFHYRNLFVIFLLSGIWHGANWTFVIWGAIHAFYILIEIQINRSNSSLKKIFINPISTFLLVSLAWIFFRSPSTHDALNIIHHCATSSFSLSFINSNYIITIALILLLAASEKKLNLYETKLNGSKEFVFLLLTLLFISILGISENEQFIYFQF